ncbi:hypothetical protein AKG09_11370 [Neisseria sp. 83E34]|nr:hypothetical protein AKG09_11370 [Neisseria sp. 83E34]
MKYQIMIKQLFITQFLLSIPSILYFTFLFINKKIIASAIFLNYLHFTIYALAFLCLLIYIFSTFLFIKNKFQELIVFSLSTILFVFNLFTINDYKCKSTISCSILDFLFNFI